VIRQSSNKNAASRLHLSLRRQLPSSLWTSDFWGHCPDLYDGHQTLRTLPCPLWTPDPRGHRPPWTKAPADTVRPLEHTCPRTTPPCPLVDTCAREHRQRIPGFRGKFLEQVLAATGDGRTVQASRASRKECGIADAPQGPQPGAGAPQAAGRSVHAAE
jgi:hypothetical protein